MKAFAIPIATKLSKAFTEAAWTRTSTSPAAGSGAGTWITSGGRSKPSSANASIVVSFRMAGAPSSAFGVRAVRPRSYLLEVDAIPELGPDPLSVGAVRERVGFEPHRDVLREQIFELVGGERLREEETLAQVAFHGDELFQLVGAFDPLGNRLEVQDGRELDHGRGERGGLAAFGHAVDEGLVHLQDVDGEAADVVEGRVSGAEVVDRELDAERLQLLEASDREIHVVDHHGLGDLEHQLAGVQAARRERFADLVDDLRTGDLPCREVHRHVEIEDTEALLQP